MTDFCIDSELSVNSGIDLGVTNLYGTTPELKFLALGDWGQIGILSMISLNKFVQKLVNSSYYYI